MEKLKKYIKYIKYAIFPLIFIYLELIYKISVKSPFSLDFIYACVSAITLGVIVNLLSSLTKKSVVNKIIGFGITSIVCIIFCVQIVYRDTFTSPFSVSIAFGGAEGVNAITEFADITITAIVSNLLWIILALLPIPLLVLASIKLKIFEKATKWNIIWLTVVAIVIHIAGLFGLFISGENGYTSKTIYYDRFIMDLSFDKLGVITSTKLDLKTFIFGVSEELDEITDKQEIPDLLGEKDTTEKPTEKESATGADDTEDGTGNIGEEPTTEEPTIEEPVVYEPNVLNIDLDAMSAAYGDNNLTWLNNYIEACEPTMKNEYTGMFEGYNVILITAESFSSWAVSEKYTPTLYKLVNSGFVFNNFYMHGYTATTIGEYMLCTGLLPNGRDSVAPFDKTIDKYMGMCMGNIMKNLGYPTYAYHNHTYTYYNRDETHPNMGYVYKGKGEGGGLEIDYVWPASDLQMMEKSIDDFINEEHFHAYYMTVSAHKNYTWTGNSMAHKNKSLVADMDATENMKGYMACSIELDRALEYLIKRLEEKGIADKTVIALAADHYPYGMKDDLVAEIGAEANKWYGLQDSNLILWSASMTEPVYIDKVCSSVDVIPTLLNLLGIDYDSRLYSGKDILSDAPGLIVFNDMGFMTDYCIYNSSTGEVKETAGVTVPKEYIDQINSLIKNMWNASGKLIQVDYYEKMKNYIK